MNICQSSSAASLLAESTTSEQDREADHAVNEKSVRASDFSEEILAIKKTFDQVRMGSLMGQEKEVKILPKKDVLRQLHKASLEESARKLQAMNKELDCELTKDGKVQLAEFASMVKALKKEMDIVEAVELDVSRESLWDMVKEGSSFRSLLESLKLKLETFLRHKPELEDKKANTIKMPKKGCEFEACLEEASGEEWREVMTESGFEVEEKNEVDLLRTKACRTALHAAEKKPTSVAEDVYEEKAGQTRTLGQMTTLSESTDAVCASNSGSCAKIMVSGGESESYREKKEVLKRLEEREVVPAMSQVDAGLTESSFPEFSIRNFVSTARSKDIKMNWPFSRKCLKLCLKRGVKNLLPPFQSLDSGQSNSTKQCLSETSLPAERSSLHEKPHWLKNHSESGSFYHGFDQKPVLICTDSNSLPSSDQDFALKATAHSQSEVESVSTSKVPLSEASDKQGAAPPIVRQKTKGASVIIPTKKRRVVVKLDTKMDRGIADDITSTCIVPPEAVATKTCPVCGNFSSSSNTTLNAHIDQCLSVEPTSDWMKDSKTVKPRIKPRKIKLMSDICATAPCCTLEDLDRRNGRICVTDADLASHANKISVGRSQRESLRHVKDTGEDSAVYIDANGTKIRILSKTNDASNGTNELKAEKSLKKGKRSKFFYSKKKHLTNNLKSSRAYVTKVGSKAYCMVGIKHLEKELTPSFKFQEQNNVIDSGNSMQSLCSEKTVLSEKNRPKGKRGRPKRKVQDAGDLFAQSHQSSFAHSIICKDIKKSSTVKMGIDSELNSMKRNTSTCKVVVDENGLSSSGRKSPLFESPVYGKGCKSDTFMDQFTRAKCCVPEASEATRICSSPVKEVEVHVNAVEKNDRFSHANEILSEDFPDPDGGMGLLSSEKTMRSSGQLSTATPTCSKVKKYDMHITDAATVISTAEIGGQFNSLEVDALDHPDKTDELTGIGSSAKLPTGGVVEGLGRSSDPESHNRLTNASGCQSSLLQFAGNLFGPEPSVPLGQSCLSDIHGMLYATEDGVENIYHSGEDVEQENSFPLVESIPIPGPPGSYLPSFRDSCFEYLQGSSLLTTSWVQSSQDVPDVDRFNSESPLSGASTISGATVVNADLGASKRPPHLVPEKVFSGSMCERTGSLAENDIISVMAGVEAEKPTPDAALNAEECHLLGQRMMQRTVKNDLGSHLSSNLNAKVTSLGTRTGESAHSSSAKDTYENLSYASTKSEFGSSLTKVISSTVLTSPSPSDCDSTVLSPTPVLRLMGKDLMVHNIDEHATARAQHSLNGSAGTQAPFSTRMPLERFHRSHDPDTLSFPCVVDSPIMATQHLNLGLLKGLKDPINVATPYKLDDPAFEHRPYYSGSRETSHCS